MTIKTERLHVAAAAIVKEVGGKEFVNLSGRPAAIQRNLLKTLVQCLVQDEGCRPRTARRHIRAALGLIDPIGARAQRTPLPVRSITFRADDTEYEAIKGPARAAVNEMLTELRTKHGKTN